MPSASAPASNARPRSWFSTTYPSAGVPRSEAVIKVLPKWPRWETWISSIEPAKSTSAGQTLQRSSCSTECKFRAEARVSSGLGVPERKGCASNTVISTPSTSVASAMANDSPARPPPSTKMRALSVMKPATSAPQSRQRAWVHHP